MFKRKMYKNLLAWKNEGAEKILLVGGARQIGKTYLIERFAESEYESFLKLDFLNETPITRALLKAESAQEALEIVSLAAGRTLEPGRTLLFLDEVQKAPNIVTLSKYLAIDGRLDIVMSGSMLGVEMRHVKSLPVGYMHIENMHPLDFEEFCWARGVPDSALARVRESYASLEPVPNGLHEAMTRTLRTYLVAGGMPDAVAALNAGNGDLSETRTIQHDLNVLYREDISKYARERAPQVKEIFEALPHQLAKENKRFALKSLGGAKYERYANDFAWLVEAGAAIKVCNVAEPRSMLARTQEDNRFKLYASDTGMLMERYPASVAVEALSGSRSVNFGAIYENYVAQELASYNLKPRYYRSTRHGEIDFLLESEGGNVIPIEVKSGKDYKLHTALNNLLGTTEWGIDRAVVLSEANVSIGERQGKPVLYLPLYMTFCVAEECARTAPGALVAPKADFSEWT